MKIFVNVARLEIVQLFTQGTRRGHRCTLDTFLVILFSQEFQLFILEPNYKPKMVNIWSDHGLS